MENLIQQSRLLIRQTVASYRRSFFQEIDWDWRLLGILGARGVGKTTLLLQKASELPFDKVIYLSLDDLFFADNSVKQTVTDLSERGYLYFFLDEVHKYAGWSREVKNLYDFLPEVKIVFTGSSIIELRKQQVDLSRRAIIYNMPVLSYREFLGLSGIIDHSIFSMQEVISRHEEIALDLVSVFSPLQHFNEYLKSGVYPFYLEGVSRYEIRLKQLVQLVVEGDLGIGSEEPVKQPQKLKQLLQVIADSVPFVPNISALASKIDLDRSTLMRYLHILSQVRFLNLIYPDKKGSSILQKPARLYLENTNLSFALSTKLPNKGNLRETYFLNQLKYKHRVNSHPKTDFLIDSQWSIEVGGRDKSARQIENIPNSFRVLDDISTGTKGRIPLWLFGFLY